MQSSKSSRGRPGSRELTISTQKEYEILQGARQFQKTQVFKDRYAKRAGVEGTISQSVYTLCRYRGIEKVHLQHILTACALNLTRIANWLSGKKRSQTRKLPFLALAAQNEFANSIRITAIIHAKEILSSKYLSKNLVNCYIILGLWFL